MEEKYCLNCGMSAITTDRCPYCQSSKLTCRYEHKFERFHDRGDIGDRCVICGHIKWIRTKNDIDDDRSFRSDLR
jgi:hypothetical protein